jgi:thioredoxin reductase
MRWSAGAVNSSGTQGMRASVADRGRVLPVERTGPGFVVTDEFGRTSVAGVYAAGDLVTVAPAVVQALASAQRAAVGVTRDLSGAALAPSSADGLRPHR